MISDLLPGETEYSRCNSHHLKKIKQKRNQNYMSERMGMDAETHAFLTDQALYIHLWLVYVIMRNISLSRQASSRRDR